MTNLLRRFSGHYFHFVVGASLVLSAYFFPGCGFTVPSDRADGGGTGELIFTGPADRGGGSDEPDDDLVTSVGTDVESNDNGAFNHFATPPALPPYVYAPSVDPNGTGKFFFGREIAHFMTYHGADWLVRDDREENEQPERLLDALNIEPGDTVADVGAGVGYFSLRLAKRVGPKGRVLAVDIQKEMLALLAENQRKAGLTNIRPILGTITDPKLPAGEVNLVLMVDVYHEFSHPVEMLQAIRRSLGPDGRVVFVEYRGEDPRVPIKLLHKMTEQQVRREAEAVGLVRQETLDFLPTQHVILFGGGSDGENAP